MIFLFVMIMPYLSFHTTPPSLPLTVKEDAITETHVLTIHGKCADEIQRLYEAELAIRRSA